MLTERHLSMQEARTPEDCRWRKVVDGENGKAAQCGFLQQIFDTKQSIACAVDRNTCRACCRSFPPTFETLNPVVASLIFDRVERLAATDTGPTGVERRDSLRRWAEEHLDIEIPDLPDPSPISISVKDRSHRPTSLRQVFPRPSSRCGDVVRHWVVGVTTAPRRRSRLDKCLSSMAQAGWPRPHLFIDGAIDIGAQWAMLPCTSRDEQLGAWPNYYLALLELLMREPLADAYMMVQDDALFYCAENLREYLEQILWPGPAPGIVSLFCAAPDAQHRAGWFQHQGRWKCSSIAFIFPREIAMRFACASSVFCHRWEEGDEGRWGIPDVIANWALETGTPFYFPFPSLTQHIGDTSAIWLGTHELEPNRRAEWFLGDDLGVTNELPMVGDQSSADFPETAFPCERAREAEYRWRVMEGRARMRASSAVICGLCRDTALQLRSTIARVERLAQMFGHCAVLVYENDSIDGTDEILMQWSKSSTTVHVISERLEQPRLAGASRLRTGRMAYYRNRCREAILEHFSDFDFVIVVDMDLLGGWSYDGVANTFGHEEWDVVGSNGLSFAVLDAPHTYEYVDAFAYRAVGQTQVLRESHAIRLPRGEPLVPVWSCFGGLGVYRMECFHTARYDGAECEHVRFHQSLREQGLDRQFLNPSQLVLYSPWKSD